MRPVVLPASAHCRKCTQPEANEILQPEYWYVVLLYFARLRRFLAKGCLLRIVMIIRGLMGPACGMVRGRMGGALKLIPASSAMSLLPLARACSIIVAMRPGPFAFRRFQAGVAVFVASGQVEMRVVAVQKLQPKLLARNRLGGLTDAA